MDNRVFLSRAHLFDDTHEVDLFSSLRDDRDADWLPHSLSHLSPGLEDLVLRDYAFQSGVHDLRSCRRRLLHL